MPNSRKRAHSSLSPEKQVEQQRAGHAGRKRRRTTWKTEVSDKDKNKAINLAVGGTKKYSWMTQADNSPGTTPGMSRAEELNLTYGPIAQGLGVDKHETPAPNFGTGLGLPTPPSAPATQEEDREISIEDLEAQLEAELEAELGADPDAEAKADAEVEAEFEALCEGEPEAETQDSDAESQGDICGMNEKDLEDEVSALCGDESVAGSQPRQTVESDEDDVMFVSSKQTGTKESPLKILSSRESSPWAEKPAEKATKEPAAQKVPKQIRPKPIPQQTRRGRRAQAKKPTEVEVEEVDDGMDEEELLRLLQAAFAFLTIRNRS
ncbi:hypothetical protein F4818DRAFT_451063 [Hypoxylon cercidicola]|nr:hypothetical protein F4818DRAFT_451063 [Hypoxylon cercidicola]